MKKKKRLTMRKDHNTHKVNEKIMTMIQKT